MTGAQENNGCEFVYRYNTDGCLEEVEDADHHIAKYGHEGARCPTSMAIDGRPVCELADAGTFRFVYAVDSSGAATQVDIKDPGNNVLRITYDRSGYRLEHIAIGKTLPALR